MVLYVLGMVLYFLGMLTAKVRLYLSGTTNVHKFALTEGRANLYPSGLKIPPPYDIKTNEFSWTTKGHASITYIYCLIFLAII